MGNRYQWESPGASAASGIQEVLAQHRELARRTMLDQLAQKQQEFENTRLTSNDKAEQAVRDQQMAASKQAMDLGQLKVAEDANEPDTEPSPGSFEILDKFGMLSKPSFSETPAPPSTPTPTLKPGEEGPLTGPLPGAIQPHYDPAKYKGTQEQRDKQEAIKQAGSISDALMNRKDLSPVELGAMLFKAQPHGIQAPPGIMQAIEPRQEMSTYSPATGKTAPLINPFTKKPYTTQGAPVMEIGFPPMPQQPPAQTPQGVDAKGNFVFSQGGAPYVYDATGKRVPYQGPFIPRDVPSRQPPVSAAQRQQLNTLVGNAAKGLPGAAAALSQGQDSIISAYIASGDASPEVADVVRQVINGGEPGKTPNADIIKRIAEDKPFKTPDEYAQFADLLAVVRSAGGQ